MTAYPMGPADDDELRRSENEGFGREAEHDLEGYGCESELGPEDDVPVAGGGRHGTGEPLGTEQDEYQTDAADRRPQMTPDDGGTLLRDGFADEFQRRWHDVQAGFVDDPQEAVRKAGELAEEAVSELTAALDQRKRALDDRWANEKDDTEHLRQSLRGYKSLMDRLVGL